MIPVHVLLGGNNVMYKYKVLCYIPNVKAIILGKTLLYIFLMFFFFLLVLIFTHTCAAGTCTYKNIRSTRTIRPIKMEEKLTLILDTCI